MIVFTRNIHPGKIISDHLVKQTVKPRIVTDKYIARGTQKRLMVGKNRDTTTCSIKMKASEGKHNGEKFLLDDRVVGFGGRETSPHVCDRSIILEKDSAEARTAHVGGHLYGKTRIKNIQELLVEQLVLDGS